MTRKELLAWILFGLLFVFLILVQIPRETTITINLELPPIQSREIEMNPEQLKEYIIRPTLEALAAFDSRMNSEAAVNLLMGTAASESELGHWVIQRGGGPALGLFQMEGGTHQSIWEHYLSKPAKWELRKIVISMLINDNFTHFPDEREMIVNTRYSTAMARIKYWKVKEAMPQDLEGQASYWKRYYNTSGGGGTIEEYIVRYEKLIHEN